MCRKFHGVSGIIEGSDCVWQADLGGTSVTRFVPNPRWMLTADVLAECRDRPRPGLADELPRLNLNPAWPRYSIAAPLRGNKMEFYNSFPRPL